MRKITLLILFALIFNVNFPNMAQAAIGDFEKGKKAYIMSDYFLAIQYFRRALRGNPTNVTYRYFLAQALVQTKDLKAAQEEYQRIIQSNPYSQEAQYAKLGLVKIKDYISNTLYPKWRSNNSNMDIGVTETRSNFNVGDNYIDKVTEKGNVMRWEAASMPLKVYIEENPRNVSAFQPAFVGAAKKGVEKWATASKGKISFSFVNRPEIADIKITWKSMLDSKLTGSEAGTAYTAGVTSPEYGDDYMSAMSIILTTTDPNGRPHEALDIEKVNTHEMGHALGIMGHSDNPKDIMYPGGDSDGNLTQRDQNTVQLLYELTPDISNARGSLTRAEKAHAETGNIGKAHNPSAGGDVDDKTKYLGSKQDRIQREIEQIQDAIKDNPKSDINHINLGNLYGDQKDYDKAIREYKMAIKLNPKNDVAFSNLGSMYQAANKPYDALKAYQDARRLGPDKPKPYLQIAFISAELDQKAEAIEALRQYLNLNPKAKKDKDIANLAEKLGIKIK